MLAIYLYPPFGMNYSMVQSEGRNTQYYNGIIACMPVLKRESIDRVVNSAGRNTDELTIDDDGSINNTGARNKSSKIRLKVRVENSNLESPAY